MKSALALLSLCAACALHAAELPVQLFRERVIAIETEPTRLKEPVWMEEYETDHPPTVTEARLAQINAAIKPDGSFEGIIYPFERARMWPAMKHLHQCRELLIGYHAFPNQRQSLDNAISGLTWWLTNKPKSKSGWDHFGYEWQILATVAVLVPPERLTPELQMMLTEKFGTVAPGKALGMTMTGQNQLWVSWTVFLTGLTLNDPQKIEAGLAAIGEVLVIAKPGREGIQSDYSFQQHGAHFYQGNYGRHFLHTASKYLRIVEGTALAHPDRKRLFEHMLLDATRLMCWGRVLDYGTIGRQVSYYNRHQGGDIRIACYNLLAANPERAAEIKTTLAELARQPFNGPSAMPAGTFAFPQSAYILHRTPTWLFTLRLASKRIIATEGSDDNQRSDNFAQGQYYLYRDGTDYQDVFPLWNPACPPGSTFRNVPVAGSKKHRTTRGGDSFAEVSSKGIAAMRLNHAGVTANKSWFFYDDRIICLGSDISSSASGTVLTTLEQMNFKEEPAVKTAGAIQAIGHAGTTWLFPKEMPFTLETANRKGNWKHLRDRNPAVEAEGRIFFLALDHGEQPNAATYAYQIFPKANSLQAPEAAWNEITLLRHDSACHAIRRGAEVRGVFFKPGELTLPDGQKIVADKPGIHTATLQD